MYVEVFKTNVKDKTEASTLLEMLAYSFPALHCNFDLEDCDRILRAASHSLKIEPDKIINHLAQQGFHCEVLTD